MSVNEQIAWVGKWMYFHQLPEDQAALEAIKSTLKDYKRLMEEVAKPAPKGQAAEPPRGRYQEFIKAYDDFCRLASGTGAKLDGAQGNAMKSIIKYLAEESKSKDEQEALDAWQYVLANWQKLTPFIQNQISLVQINKNLAEVLMQLRRNGKTQPAQASDDVRQSIRNRRGGAGEGGE